MKILAYIGLLIGLTANLVRSQCPCDPATLCAPINDTSRKEVFAFVPDVEGKNDTWMKFDWQKLTSIVLVNFYDAALYCHAKANNVRVLNIANFPVADLLDKGKRENWILSQIKESKAKFLDGINIDFEDPIDSSQAAALTDLVHQATNSFHAMLPGSQVTFDVPYAPFNAIGEGMDGRAYDFVGLAKACDFLFVMSYDQRSQAFARADEACIAQANSDCYVAWSGVQGFLDLGINASKLVFGQPWYGYDYQCIAPTAPNPQGNNCYIKEVEWRGVNCSDAAGTQIPYGDIVDKYLPQGHLSEDPYSRCYYIDYVDANSTTHQIWFDRAESYQVKYEAILALGLRGVGMWTANYLNYSNDEMVNEMWGALPNYNKLESAHCIEETNVI